MTDRCTAGPAATFCGRALLLACLLVAWGCARAPGPDTCRVEVMGVESRDVRPGVADIAYRVRGYAGSPGRVWLAARRGSSDYLSGPGLEVGPGPFEAIVDLHLTAVPPAYLAVLDIGSKRCTASP